AVSHPAASRGSTVSLPAPDRPLPPEAAWSCLLSSRALSSFSKPARSTLTGWVGNPTVAADGVSVEQPAEAASPAAQSPASATAAKRRADCMAVTLLADRRRGGSGGGPRGAGRRFHRGRLLPGRHQLGQHRQQPLHDLQAVLLGADRPRGG